MHHRSASACLRSTQFFLHVRRCQQGLHEQLRALCVHHGTPQVRQKESGRLGTGSRRPLMHKLDHPGDR